MLQRRPDQYLEAEILSRCMQVVDFVSEMAVNIIIDFVQNPPCPEAKHYLVKGPEEVAIKALEKALNSLVCVGARPKGPVH